MITRRQMAGGLLGAAAVGVVPRISRASASGPVKLAFVSTLSGPFAMMTDAEVAAVKRVQIDDAKSLGLAIEPEWIDDQGDPGKLSPKIVSAVQEQGIHFFGGAVLSNVGLALSSQLAGIGGVYMASVGADEVTGTQCRRTTFRWPLPTYGAIRATVGPLFDMLPKAKRWYTITTKYAFGEALLRNAKEVFAEKGIEHVGNDYHSLAESEFSSYVSNAAAANPDVLLLLNFGPQSTNTLRVAGEFGLKSKMKILLAWDVGLEQYEALGSDLLDGIYLGTQYWHEINSPGNKRLVAIFNRNGIKYPSYGMVTSVMALSLLTRGIVKAGSTDPAAVIKALDGLSYQGPTGTEIVQPYDHQVKKYYYLIRGKAPTAKTYPDQYVEIVSSGNATIDQARSMCKMA
jgi:branched-chain amino acid transport system substrate-binding protein